MKALLVLEDGTVFEGYSFTGPGEAVGEVVFNTSMTGYQEILTDPSYKGQIVTMTYPLIGNYGVNDEDVESSQIQVEGLIVREYCPFPSNWRSQKSLADYLREAKVLGVEGIDTRALTRRLRIYGAMKGIVSTEDLDPDSLLERLKAFPSMVGRDLATPISTKKPYFWNGGDRIFLDSLSFFSWRDKDKPYKVVVYDGGVKFNILRELEARGCELLVVPIKTSAEEVFFLGPTGVFLSNGPGDPAAIKGVIQEVKKLVGKIPIFGICLGHQIIGLAMGGRTFKLKFGHRGANHPVKNLSNGRVEITSQNHGFCVDIDSLSGSGMEVTHVNLNDGTLEGMKHNRFPLFSVQYHPESSPGPHDSKYLFDEFIRIMS